MRSETRADALKPLPVFISIHSPRAERDGSTEWSGSVSRNFNPLAPCGARLKIHVGDTLTVLFQSTRPVRSETWFSGLMKPFHSISIHSPRAKRDRTIGGQLLSFLLFQSTRPVRSETHGSLYQGHGDAISIHSPRAERDELLLSGKLVLEISIHSPRAERD